MFINVEKIEKEYRKEDDKWVILSFSVRMNLRANAGCRLENRPQSKGSPQMKSRGPILRDTARVALRKQYYYTYKSL